MARNLAHEDDPRGTGSDEATERGAQTVESDDGTGSKALLNRRNYIRLGAAAAATVAGVGASNTAAAASTADEYGMEFDRVVDAVDDLGWDPDGNEPVTDSLQENMQDGTLIELPPGTYLVDEMCSENDLTNWGVRGTGDSRADARFVIPHGKAQRVFNVRDDSRNVLVENLTFDQYDTWETCIGNVFQCADNLVLKDVTYAGKTPSEDTGATSRLNVYVFDPDGEMVIDGLKMRGPSELVEYPSNPLALFSGPESKGTIWIRNCEFENCGECAIYASRCEGDVRIENSLFRNNMNAQARISGEGSWAKNCRFVWDISDHDNAGEFHNMTGLTFESGFQGFAGGLVENCEFVCRSSAPNSGCLKVDGSHGAVTVRDCTFQVDADGAEPIWTDAPGDSHMIDGTPSKPWDVQLDNVHIHGSSESVRGHTGAVNLISRDGSEFRNGCIDMTGNRDGVVLADMSASVADSNIEVPGEAVVLENADATTSNITHSACDGSDSGSTDDSTSDGSTDDGSTSDGSTSDGSTSDGSTDDSATYANDLTVFAEAGAQAFEYEVVVDGEAALVTSGQNAATDASANGGVGEEVVQNDDGTVSILGVVADGGGDSFTYDGSIVDFQAGGPTKVVRNGEVVDLGLLTDADTVRVFATAGAEAFTYEFDVTGDAELVTSGENASTPASQNGGVGEEVVQNDDGTVTVSGVVADGGGDSFRTSGEITAFRTDGNPVVYRNGDRFDWRALGYEHTLTIEGTDEVASYTATVSGDVTPNPATGTFDDGDSVQGSTVEGAVLEGTDSYLYSGAVTSIQVTGPATVRVDGEEVDPASLGLDHELRVVGVGEPANYGLTVDGDLAVNPDGGVSEDDVVDGATATGSVSTESDAYLFSGEVTAFDLQGTAAVYVDGQQVDPAALAAGTDAVLANRLTVNGSGTESGYTFAVSGDVAKAPDIASAEAGDEITDGSDGDAVTGTVAGDDDGYRFSGDLRSLKVDGSAAITFADLDG